jgi:hypothetical protein
VRLCIATITVALMCPSLAAAQSYYCSRPTEPYIPSAYSADHDRMRRAEREVEEYFEEMGEYLECVAREHSDASYEADSVLDDWNRTVRNYNNQ